MFEGFELSHAPLSAGTVRVRTGGSGPALLLLHGHPRTHTTWHRAAPLLAQHYTVVCPDLPGFGQSFVPADQPGHVGSSKRAKAAALTELMHQLGHSHWAVAGHDRGSYTALRMALDVPQHVTHLAVLDGVPIAEALARADARFAQEWWHWFFFAQPDKPERAILADPDAWYGHSPEKAAQMGQDNYQDYRAAIHDPAVIHGMVEDYRAGLVTDRSHDEADRAAGRQVQAPTLVLWAEQDDMGRLYGDVLAVWRLWVAGHLSGHSLPCGHHMAEEAPAELAAALHQFLETN
ncbi:alpha/beta fold hydrolase [Deinococcus radiophilus]|uniref:Alpha/beta hydrolase n=1 Tax=Deinococcus radiophilus TaxID=32062 RepID=A0A3S0ICS7_9DEIO|nr:alpha/beta hydrolase [Deinococcus radiophilus]RTR30711.1 alpha/beta hydrolase [Deinococcus radiophilus]UFA51264.1 alpha/beta hydrolase [Deinococcus radiophilus]